MFLFANGQLRTNNANCVSGSATDNGSATVTACTRRCIDETSGVDASCVNRADFSEEDLPLNGVTVVASSSYEATPWSKAFAVDGLESADLQNGAYGYSSEPQSPGQHFNHTETLELDLPTIQVFDTVILYPRNDPGFVGAGFPIDFKIQVWNGSTWLDRVTKTAYPMPIAWPQTFTWGFSDATDKVRLYATNLRQVASDGYLLQLGEMEVYANSPGPSGLPTLTMDWTMLFDNSQQVSTQFSNSTEIDDAATYYRTFGLVNKNVCVRRVGGVYCAASNGNQTTPTLLTAQQLTSEYSDALGWYPDDVGSTVSGVWNPTTSTTIACGRGFYGAFCTSGSTSSFSTGAGWAAGPYYYDSIRYVDVTGDSKPDICGRGIYGIECAINQGSSFGTSTFWSTEFTDAELWNTAGTGDTVQFGDVDGDGRADICGRGDYGVECAVGTNAAFVNDRAWSFDSDRRTNIFFDGSYASDVDREFSNADPVVNWKSSTAYYATLRLVDVNRDGFADLCGRGPAGIYCSFSTGRGFDRRRLVNPLEFTDSSWSAPSSGATISYGDLDGDLRVDICGRGASGVVCAEGY